MKLTEQELAKIFQDSTVHSNDTTNVSDCLSSPNVSDAEAIVSHFSTAQATRLAIHMKPWSEQVGHDLTQSQQTPSWMQRTRQLFSQWLPDSPAFTPALAVIFTLSAVVFLSHQQSQTSPVSTNMVTNDVINSLPFEGNNDRLSKGGFDNQPEKDRLFEANFS